MRFAKTIPIAIVALMMLGGCLGIFVHDADASVTNIVNDAAPLKIDSDGKITGDYASWGATYSYDSANKVATLTFNGNYNINCNGDEYVISSDVDLVVKLNGNLTIADGKTVGDSFYGITSNKGNLTISGPGSLTLVTPNASEDASAVGCLYANNELRIENATVILNIREIKEADAHAIESNDIYMTNTRLTITTDGKADNQGNVYGTQSNGLTVDGCIIDMNLHGYHCSGFRSTSTILESKISDSIIDISMIAEKSAYGSYGPKLRLSNSDMTVFARGDAKTEGVNKVLQTDHSNVSIDAGTKTIDGSLTQLDADNELLDADGNVVTREAFLELKKGTIHNLKVTLKFDLGGGEGTPVERIVGPHGDYAFLPGCDATKDGKKFVGWTDGFRMYYEGDLYIPRISLTLTAVYGESEESHVAVACAVAAIPTLALLGMNFVGRRP